MTIAMKHPKGVQTIEHLGTQFKALADGLFHLPEHLVEWAEQELGLVKADASQPAHTPTEPVAAEIGKTVLTKADGTTELHEPADMLHVVLDTDTGFVRKATDEERAQVEKAAAEGRTLPVDGNGFRLGGPTLEQFLIAGYKPESYPPPGFAIVESAELTAWLAGGGKIAGERMPQAETVLAEGRTMPEALADLKARLEGNLSQSDAPAGDTPPKPAPDTLEAAAVEATETAGDAPPQKSTEGTPASAAPTETAETGQPAPVEEKTGVAEPSAAVEQAPNQAQAAGGDLPTGQKG